MDRQDLEGNYFLPSPTMPGCLLAAADISHSGSRVGGEVLPHPTHRAGISEVGAYKTAFLPYSGSVMA